MTLHAKGTGGSVLALREEAVPYPVQMDLTAGRTHVQANGTFTGLTKRSAVDRRLAVSGDSLDQLFPLLGIPAPVTHASAAQGRLMHSGNNWRYQGLTGHIGASDIAGIVQVTTGGKRPELSADLTSSVTATSVLPDMPFKKDRWISMDADVRLRAKQIRRAKELPLDDLTVHLVLRDAVLTLTRLNFGVAGGHLRAELTLDGRNDPIRATAQLKVDKLLLSKLLPAAAVNQ